MSRYKACIVVAVAVSILACGKALAEDWPTFMGPHGNWTSNDKGLADEWPKDGPPVVWATTNLGGGFSSPVVAGGKVFVIGRPVDTSKKDKDGNYPVWPRPKCMPVPDVLTCLDRKTGKTLWTHEFNLLTKKDGTASTEGTAWNTPTVDGDFVYARGGDGDVRCISAKDGKTAWVWPKSDPAWNKKLPGGYSIAASVTICDDSVIFMGAGVSYKMTMVCLDKKTGAPVWTKDTGCWLQVADNYPVIEIKGEKMILAGGMILKAKTGEKVGGGFYNESNGWTANVEGTRYFGSKGKAPLPCALDMIAAVDIDLKTTNGCVQKWEWWPTDAHATGFQGDNCYQKAFGNPIVKDGHLFVFMGRKGEGQQLYCLDTETGKETWPKPATPKTAKEPLPLGFTCLLCADGKLFYVTQWGTLVMIATDPKEYRLLGTAKVVGTTISSPAISDGFAFVRDDLGVLKCLDLRAQK